MMVEDVNIIEADVEERNVKCNKFSVIQYMKQSKYL